MKPIFFTIPHSGESVPAEAFWLKGLEERILMCDVDRFVDQLYCPILKKKGFHFISSPWHRYSGDLNRFPEDVDQDSVIDSKEKSGTHPKGFLWVFTTQGTRLIEQPISELIHKQLVEKYYLPFHKSVDDQFKVFRDKKEKNSFHLDLHSMPSIGTRFHNDPGQTRAEIVVSDVKGQSSEAFFKDLVIQAYEKAGFEVAYNWPYYGGRVIQRYGKPQNGIHSIQVEMSRAIYMDEVSKQKKSHEFELVQKKLSVALDFIYENL